MVVCQIAAGAGGDELIVGDGGRRLADIHEGEDGAGGAEGDEGVGVAEVLLEDVDGVAEVVAEPVGVVVEDLARVVVEVLAEGGVAPAPGVNGAAGDADGAGDGGIGLAAKHELEGEVLAGRKRREGGGGAVVNFQSGKFWEVLGNGSGRVRLGWEWGVGAQVGRARERGWVGTAVADIVSSSSLWARGEGRMPPREQPIGAGVGRVGGEPRVYYTTVLGFCQGEVRSRGAGWWKGGVRYNAGAESGMEVRSEGERMHGQGDGAGARRSRDGDGHESGMGGSKLA